MPNELIFKNYYLLFLFSSEVEIQTSKCLLCALNQLSNALVNVFILILISLFLKKYNRFGLP